MSVDRSTSSSEKEKEFDHLGRAVVAVGSEAALLEFGSPQPCLELCYPGLCGSAPVSVKWDDTVPDPKVCEALATVGLVREILHLCWHFVFQSFGPPRCWVALFFIVLSCFSPSLHSTSC